MKKYILLGHLFLFLAGLSAQPPAGNPLRWQKSYGGTSVDIAYSIDQTSDGGYIVAGSTSSNDMDVTTNYGAEDFWVLKLDASGMKQWEYSYGGPGTDVANCVIQTTDLGYIVAGYTNSVTGQITQSYGNFDYWVVKLSASGSMLWQHSYGGADIDQANDIIQTSDGGFMIAGKSYSPDGLITNPKGMSDAWLVKINSSGTLEWARNYGGSLLDEAKSVIQTPDMGYLVACSSNSADSNVTVNHGAEDYWIIKLNSLGVIQWQKSFGGSSGDIPSKIIKTNDNNFFVAGTSSSNDGDVTGNHLSQDYWGVKFNLAGNIIWQKSLGGSNTDVCNSVIQAPDSSFILSGYTQSFDGDVLLNHGMIDVWTVKLDKNGNAIIWSKTFGGSNYDFSYSITSGAYASTVFAGSSNSTDGNLTSNYGLDDYWIADVKNLTAAFTATSDTICAKQTVGFTNYTVNATSFQWKINNIPFTNTYNSSFTFNTPGLFNVTLIASNAISVDSMSIQILVQPLPDISLGNDTSICPGNSITLDPGFSIDYNYYWSTGMTTPTITVISAGIYAVTVTDIITGCITVDSITVYTGAPVVAYLGSDRTDCIGNTVTLTPGSSTGVSYLWNTGATTQSINVTTTGDYSITVTNISTGCWDRDTVHVTFNPKPNVNLGPDQNVCAGTNVTLDAGFFPGGSYNWSTSENTQTIHPTSTGYFDVTVMNSYGCVGKDTVHVTFNPKPNVNLGVDYNICSNTSTILDAGYFSGATYSWSTGASSQSITVSSGNTYSVTVTNIVGCSDADTITINVVTSPVADLGSDQTACIGDTITLDAQNSGSTYYWSTGVYSQTIAVYTSGQYSVTVSNLTNGCSDVDTVTINFITAPVVNLGPDQSVCAGDTAWLSAPYIAGAVYAWSGGSSGQYYPATSTGTYSVTVTLTGGCSDADTVNITVNTPPDINLGQDITSCTGDTVTIGAACTGCTYNWQPGGQSTAFIDVYVSNTFILKATDANGCADADTINVLFNPSPAIVVDSIKYVSCYGSSDGAVYTTIDYGTPPFSYQWSDSYPANDDHINLIAGNYSLTVTDANGCSSTTSIPVNQPAQLVIDSAAVTNTSCPNTYDGNIDIFASGGVIPYQYSIDGGNSFQPTSTFQNLALGVYSVTVKDQNGCIASLSGITVSSNSNLAVFLGNDTTICYGSSITLDAGNPGATYYWTPSGTTGQTNTVTAGTYSVTVSFGGCNVSDSVVIDEFLPITITVDSVINVSCNGGSDGIIFTTVSGGTPQYTYAWMPNNGTAVGSNYMNLTTGTYIITVTDSIGCTASQSSVVTEPAALTIITDSVNSISCYSLTNAEIYISPGGGTSPYYYIWSSGQTTDDITNLPAGNYSVTCTDANGCTASEAFTITSPSQLTITIDSIVHAIVCGSATGALYITADGGTLPYTYSWSDGTVNDDDIGIYPGTYAVTVNDNNGCSVSASETVYDNYCQVYVAAGTNSVSICDSTSYIDVGPIALIEYADTSSGFIKSQNAVHLILNAPTNFEFEANTGNIYYGNGNNDITSASISVDPSFIDITFSTGSSYNRADTLSITGIRAKATSNTIYPQNAILMDPSSTALINGITQNTVFGSLHQSTEMTVSNVTTFHADTTDMVRGSLYNNVAGIKISTNGNCGTPLTVQEFELSTATSDNPYDNIIEARIFYTGHSPYFGAVDIQGTYILPDGNFSIVAATPQELLEGDNYFWLTYDIKDSAIVGDSIEGQCIKVIIDGNYYYANVIPPQPLKRMVNSPGSFISHHTGNWDEAYTWDNSKVRDKTAWAPDVNDDVTINSGDTITLTSNASCRHLTINDGLLIVGSYQLTISGNLTGNEKDSIRTTSSSKLVINDYGSATQFPIPKAMKALKKLTLNRATGASCNHDLHLDDNVVSPDTVVLVLSNGALVMGSGKILLLEDKAIQKNITSSNSTYVDGLVSRNIKRNSGFYIYPLGNNSECRPFGVATQAGNSDNINVVQFFLTTPINFTYVDYHFLPGGITDKMYWYHYKKDGANPQRRIYYHDDDFPGLSAAERDSALCLANNSGITGSEWTKETTPYDVYDDAGKKYVEFTSANASNDPYWTFGSVVESSPLNDEGLPIELINFDATLNDELTVDLEWTTASETNNDYFTVERAGSDMQFSSLLTVNGAGNSYSLLAYHATDDDPLPGISYYRLKQTDFNGDYTYSDIRTIVWDADNPVIVYPNPTRDNLTIQFFSQQADNVTIGLYDDKGSRVLEKEVSIVKGTNEVSIDMQHLSHEVYILRIDFENNTIKPYRIRVSRI